MNIKHINLKETLKKGDMNMKTITLLTIILSVFAIVNSVNEHLAKTLQ